MHSKKNGKRAAIALFMAALLVFAFWYGGNTPDSKGFDIDDKAAVKDQSTALTVAERQTETAVSTSAEKTGEDDTKAPDSEKTDVTEEKTTAEADKDKHNTEPATKDKTDTTDTTDTSAPSNGEYSCTISISCAVLLDNMDYLDPEKAELVPKDGWILNPLKVTFYEGESVFNVLQRTCKQNKIHMEYMDTPLYNSAYIESINNIYEFDAGEQSGWMYEVNGWFPNYGCSRYELKDGDVINWVYTCDLGKDVGGDYAAGNR